MSDRHYCLLRDLGPVKGGKGLKHHEVVIDFNRQGMVELFRRLIGIAATALLKIWPRSLVHRAPLLDSEVAAEKSRSPRAPNI